jgi:hypothetical protein
MLGEKLLCNLHNADSGGDGFSGEMGCIDKMLGIQLDGITMLGIGYNLVND